MSALQLLTAHSVCPRQMCPTPTLVTQHSCLMPGEFDSQTYVILCKCAVHSQLSRMMHPERTSGTIPTSILILHPQHANECMHAMHECTQCTPAHSFTHSPTCSPTHTFTGLVRLPARLPTRSSAPHPHAYLLLRAVPGLSEPGVRVGSDSEFGRMWLQQAGRCTDSSFSSRISVTDRGLVVRGDGRKGREEGSCWKMTPTRY